MTTLIDVAAIKLSQRHRKDPREINVLAASIAERGLLQPLAVWPDHTLACGSRRLLAVQQLGWKQVPVHVLSGADDLLSRLKAERDENVCRCELLPTEAVALGREIEVSEREEARKRQKEGGKSAGRGRPKQKPTGSANLAEPVPEEPSGTKAAEVSSANLAEEKGDTRDKAAEAVGMSHGTYEKAKAVVANGCEELKEAMDAKTVAVSAAAAVACLPQDEQRELLAEGPEAVTTRAKEIREEQKRSREAEKVRHIHSERVYAWLRAVAGETEVIDLKLGGIGTLLAERDRWDWSVVSGQILPALEELEETISRYRKEIDDALQQADS